MPPMKRCNGFFHGASSVWKSIPKSRKTLMTLPFLKGQWVLLFSLYCFICLYLFVGVCLALSFLDIISSPLEYSPRTWSWFIQHLHVRRRRIKEQKIQVWNMWSWQQQKWLHDLYSLLLQIWNCNWLLPEGFPWSTWCQSLQNAAHFYLFSVFIRLIVCFGSKQPFYRSV